VDEDVVAGLGLNEAIAPIGVEPLHGSNSHGVVPPSINLEVSITPRQDGTDGKGTSSTVNYQANREPVLRPG
jgi:hypothetical protein